MRRNKLYKKHYRYVDYDVMHKILGCKVKEIRLNQELTRGMLTSKSESDRNSVRRMENAENKNGTTTINLFRIAVALDVPLQELMKEIDDYCHYGINKYTNE